VSQPELNSRLIHTKVAAVIVLCCTVYIAALSFRNVLSHAQRQHRWLLDYSRIDYPYFTLPVWAITRINLAFYAYLFWGAIVLYRMARGPERILVAGGFADISLGLFQILVSASAATVIDYVKAIVGLIAAVAAADILAKVPPGGYPRNDNQTSRNITAATPPPTPPAH
jgi:hypothetical protein